jgi:DNA-binding NarL/FixJ family response regulator
MPAVSPAAPPLRVLVITDQRVHADLLAFALDASPALSCAATASTLDEGCRKLAACDVGAAVIDVPVGDEVDVRSLAAVSPGTRILLLTAHPTVGAAARALRGGASAYLAKDTRLDDLVDAIHHATPDDPRITAGLAITPFDTLSPRQRDILELLCRGCRPAQIATELGLSPHTVRDHIKALREALGARSQLEAVALALAGGHVALPRRRSLTRSAVRGASSVVRVRRPRS